MDFHKQLRESMVAIEKNNERVDDILEEGEVDQSKPGKENDKLKCNVEGCQGKAFAKPFALLRHWAEIHEQQVTLYKCEGCTKVFRRATDVKQHSPQKHQAEAKAIPINCHNKFYLAPGSVQLATRIKCYQQYLQARWHLCQNRLWPGKSGNLWSLSAKQLHKKKA